MDGMRGRTIGAALAALLVLGACSSDDGGDDADDAAADTTEAPTEDTTTTTAAPAETFRILVSNDDGYAAEGIDALVEGLLTLADVEVTVYAPLENQSGTSDSTTPGEETATEETTNSGHPAVAVDGFPADSVEAGLAAMAEPPHLVVSGINEGQNIGPLTELSGTVGAARTAARAGIPAFAVSQGFFLNGGPEPDYPAAVELTLAWIEEHRDELVAAEPGSGVAAVTNLNVPTCPSGELGELLEVPVATEDQVAGQDLGAVDCEAGPNADLSQDVAGFLAGHPVLSELTA
jgi:5'-nucleotidase